MTFNFGLRDFWDTSYNITATIAIAISFDPSMSFGIIVCVTWT
jgi:hypothetical protein